MGTVQTMGLDAIKKYISDLVGPAIAAAIKPVTGSRTASVSGAVTLASDVATHFVTATGATTLKLAAPAFAGQVMSVVVKAGGASIIVSADVFPRGEVILSDSDIVNFVATDDGKWWCFGSSAGSSGPVPVTPTAPTFTDDTSANGGGTYTIPSKSGVAYSVAIGTGTASVQAPGTYTAAGSALVKITTAPTDESRYYLADGATTSWQHTYPASTIVAIGNIDFTKQAAGTDISTLKLSNGAALSVSGPTVTTNMTTGAALTATSGTPQTTITASASLARLRFTTSYSMTGNDTNNFVALGFTTPYPTMLCVCSNGSINAAWVNGNFHGTLTVPSGYVAPASGTAVCEWNTATLTLTITINGTLAATWVGDRTGSGTWGTSAGGVSIGLSAWNSKTSGIKDLTIQGILG